MGFLPVPPAVASVWQWCPVCGGALAAWTPVCPYCGTDVRYDLPVGSYRRPPPPRHPDHRTRWGLLLHVFAALIFWIPTVSYLGGFLLSIGSYLLYRDRRRIGAAHARSTLVAFVLLAVVFVLYTAAFVAFLVLGNQAYIEGLRLNDIRGLLLNFTLATTVPTILLVVSLNLQVRNLIPGKRLLLLATVLLILLVVAATVLAYLQIAPGLPDEPLRIATVLPQLDRIAILRMVEAPGFLLLAYLYFWAWRIRTGRVSVSPVAA